MRLVLLVAAALAAFAGNSLLCRLALRTTAIDPAAFTGLRLGAGALVLWLLLRGRARPAGDWLSAACLFTYAAAFSFAYAGLTAGTGALLLFGAVQASMMAVALARGERLRPVQWAGSALALAGLLALLLPGVAAPDPARAALMLAAGVAWGLYSLRGRGVGDATAATAGNFIRAVPLAALLALVSARAVDAPGALYAVLSGALTSGLGYALWYAALPGLSAGVAATVQLCVPALAALGAVAVLDEPLTLRLLACSAAILGGIALVTLRSTPRVPAPASGRSGAAPPPGSVRPPCDTARPGGP